MEGRRPGFVSAFPHLGFVSGYRFSDTASLSESDAPSGAGLRPGNAAFTAPRASRAISAARAGKHGGFNYQIAAVVARVGRLLQTLEAVLLQDRRVRPIGRRGIEIGR